MPVSTHSPSLLKPLHETRKCVFFVLAATFLASMTLNVIGLPRFIQWNPLTLALGLLSYPLVFLRTDLISKFYGKRQTSLLVWVGLGASIVDTLLFYTGVYYLRNFLRLQREVYHSH